MERKHPHSGATYRVLERDDLTFGVEVKIPDTNPTTVTSFASKEEAERWITRHKEGIAKGEFLRRRLPFR